MDNPGTSCDVSVIVPARNEQDCLADCLRTLTAQQGVSYEIIVVDDHSTDATTAIAAKFAVRVIKADPLPAGWSGQVQCRVEWRANRERELAAIHRRRHQT